MARRFAPPQRRGFGFTFIEMLVSMVIIVIIMAVVASSTSMISKTWKSAAANSSSFQKARAAFDSLTQTLSQATLNTYWDYMDANGNPRTSGMVFTPASYKRASELHFVSGPAANLVPGGNAGNTQGHAVFFQSVLGRSNNSTYQVLNSSLNSVGFYVQYSNDSTDWPGFIGDNYMARGNYRFRLMEWMPQTQNMHVYDSVRQPGYNIDWVSQYLPSVGLPATGSQEASRTLAENVALLIILPKLAPQDEANLAGETPAYPGTLLCPTYEYDSRAWSAGYSASDSWNNGRIGVYSLSDVMRNQLPPLVDVVMVAVSEKDVTRLQAKYAAALTSAPPELQVPIGANPSTGQPFFQQSCNLSQDIQAYENQLVKNHIDFKTFWSTVPIYGAKWSAN